MLQYVLPHLQLLWLLVSKTHVLHFWTDTDNQNPTIYRVELTNLKMCSITSHISKETCKSEIHALFGDFYPSNSGIWEAKILAPSSAIPYNNFHLGVQNDNRKCFSHASNHIRIPEIYCKLRSKMYFMATPLPNVSALVCDGVKVFTHFGLLMSYYFWGAKHMLCKEIPVDLIRILLHKLASSGVVCYAIVLSTARYKSINHCERTNERTNGTNE